MHHLYVIIYYFSENEIFSSKGFKFRKMWLCSSAWVRHREANCASFSDHSGINQLAEKTNNVLLSKDQNERWHNQQNLITLGSKTIYYVTWI